MQQGPDDTADPVREGRYPVHEDPEPRKGGRWLEHTAEDQAQRYQQRDEGVGGFDVRECGNDEVRERACVYEQL